MRIAYGIHGYGRGHATRALAVLSDLVRKHEVLILAGGDAYDAVRESHQVVRIPTLGYYYRASGTRSNWMTMCHNLPGFLDFWLKGPVYHMVEDAFQQFRPDAIITDAEPWTAHVGKRLGIPRIGFDHFGVMAYCRPAMNRLDAIMSFRDEWVYRRMMASPERVIVSSFYDARPRRPGVRFVGTLLRDEVSKFEPVRGDYLLAYFNKGQHLFSKRIRNALHECDLPVRVYGTGRTGVDRNLEYRLPGNLTFLEDLAGCRAVISTAGNQLVGEALHFRKPMLVMPEDCIEQRVNARGLVSLGIGEQESQFRIKADTIHRFLAREHEFLDNIASAARNGRFEAITAVEQCLSEIVEVASDADALSTQVA